LLQVEQPHQLLTLLPSEMSQIRAPFEFALRVLHNSEASRDHIRRQVHPTRMEWRLLTDLLAQFSTESYGESGK
jgi:hypothetical protein